MANIKNISPIFSQKDTTMAIRYKLGLIVAGLSLIIISMFLVTWDTTSALKADGLVINLAGRQRMLSQKMSKELFSFATTTEAEKIFNVAENAEVMSEDMNAVAAAMEELSTNTQLIA